MKTRILVLLAVVVAASMFMCTSVFAEEASPSLQTYVTLFESNQLDVTGNGIMTPLDVLYIVNMYNLVFAYPGLLPDESRALLDQNGDGMINMADAEIAFNRAVACLEAVWQLRTYVTQFESNQLDVTGDGIVTPLDVLYIVSMYNLAFNYSGFLPDESKSVLDQNGDGMINQADADIAFDRAVAGLGSTHYGKGLVKPAQDAIAKTKPSGNLPKNPQDLLTPLQGKVNDRADVKAADLPLQNPQGAVRGDTGLANRLALNEVISVRDSQVPAGCTISAQFAVERHKEVHPIQ